MKRMIPFVFAAISLSVPAFGADVVDPLDQRFAAGDTKEVPDFRRHVIPVMGKLGCNGRACHGSFQGRGGFRLSLFGYDFKMDHDGLTAGEFPRVDLKETTESLMLQKATLGTPHEGGKRTKAGSWEYNVFKSWIEGGAKGVEEGSPEFVKIVVTPAEIIFNSKGQAEQLQVTAVWSDGTHEDVTPLARFQTNSDQVAQVEQSGLVTASGTGDTHVVVYYDNGVLPVPVIRPVSDLIGPRYPKVPTPTKVDELVVVKLRKLGMVPSEKADDADFLRRVRLDMTGTLPSPKEVERFLADTSLDKRTRKIDELLETSAYVAWWTTKLCDFTGNNNDQLNNVTPVREQAGKDWYNWIYKRVASNTSYADLAAGIVTATSREEGESFRQYSETMSKMYGPNPDGDFTARSSMPHYWARRNFRQPEDRVIGFAYTFMGIRMQCAQCHKHPFDQWTQVDFKQFTPFFTSTTFRTDPKSQDEYKAMIKELGLDELRGGQQRRELANRLREGKTVPFQEVYVQKQQRRSKNNNLAKSLRNLQKQMKQLTERIDQLKNDDKAEQAKRIETQLAALKKREKRAKAQVKQANDRASAALAKLLGGDKIDLAKHDDPRTPLMEWLRSKDNKYFAKAFVNRVWAAYFNRGIVEPADDMSLANPPANAGLLAYLSQGFIDSNFDMKWLHREIANSRTYQLSWKPNDTNRLDETNFSHAIPRRMPAEVAYDALKQATSSDTQIAAMHSDVTGRAISLAVVGRRNRGGSNYALTIFGRSVRESNCDCDRSSEASLLQTVYLQNDQEVLAMIDRRGESWLNQVADELGTRYQPTVTTSSQNNSRSRQLSQLKRQVAQGQAQLKKAKKSGDENAVKKAQQQLERLKRRQAQYAKSQPNRGGAKQTDGEKVAALDADAIVRQAYLRTVSRYPTKEELGRARKYIEEADDTINGVRGLLWALLNTKEFIVNH